MARLSVHIRRASSASRPGRMSWPPTTMRSKATKSRRENGSSAVTNPTGSTARRASAASPVITVVATPPLAPTSHRPIGGGCMRGFRKGPGSRGCWESAGRLVLFCHFLSHHATSQGS